MASSIEVLALSTTQAARLLDVSRPTLYKMMQEPGFPKFKVGARTLISTEGLREWVQLQVQKGGV